MRSTLLGLVAGPLVPGDEPGWQPEAGARPTAFIRSRTVGMLAMAAAAAVLRPLGPHRFVLAALIAGVFMPLALVAERRLASPWKEVSQPFIDVLGIVSLIYFVPSGWFTALLVGTCSVTAGYMVMTRWQRVAAVSLLFGGMAVAARVMHVPGTLVPLLVLPTVLLPVGAYAEWYQSLHARAARRMGLLVDSAEALLWEVQVFPLRLLDVRGRCEQVTGHPTAELTRHLLELIHPDDLPALVALDLASPTFDLTFRVRTPTGEWRHLRSLGRLGTSELTRRRAHGITFDVTELEESRRALRVNSETDELTGLRNRRGLARFLDEHLADEATEVAFALLDLDGFKDINDTLGHPVGDRLIETLGDRLSELRTDRIELARLGGDEFGIALVEGPGAGLSLRDEAMALADAACATIARPAMIDGLSLTVSASIGVAVGRGRASASNLMRDADIAMYAAKRGRTGVELFTEAPAGLTADRLALQADLVSGLESEMELWFQPIVDAATGVVRSVEGLARWQHPTRGLLLPGTFLDAIDAARANDRFDRLVLELATERAAALSRLAEPVSVAVNLSARSLWSASLMAHLEALLRAHPGASGNVTVEISERDLLDDNPRVLPVLYQLRALGIGLSIDDYGTGFSSLIRLRDLPFTELKIDRSFVAGITTDPTDTAIVRSTLDLARSLGMVTVAEGVEHGDVWAQLRDWECDRIQGWLFGKAVPADRLVFGQLAPSADPPSTGSGPGRGGR